MTDEQFFEKCVIYIESKGYTLITLDRARNEMFCLKDDGSYITIPIPKEDD